MANTKTPTAVSKTQSTEIDNSALIEENKRLKENIENMEAKLNLLIQQFASMAQPVKPQIDEEKEIEVTNLCIGRLVLSTTGKSDGRRYDFMEQFETRLIPESDLKEIIRAMPTTAKNGMFFINDVDFVKANKLSSSYKNILDVNGLYNIFNSSADFLNKYRSASQIQKTIIENMVSDKSINGEEIDANILKALSKETGRDFMNIDPILEELRSMKEG